MNEDLAFLIAVMSFVFSSIFAGFFTVAALATGDMHVLVAAVACVCSTAAAAIAAVACLR